MDADVIVLPETCTVYIYEPWFNALDAVVWEPVT